MKRREFGIAFLTDVATNRFVEAATLAETAGLDSFWIAESHYYRGIFAMLGHLAGVNSKIKLGIGVASPFTRHPATIAMEAATIDEMTGGGRLSLGLGISRRMMLGLGVAASPLIKEEITSNRINPLRAMRESIEIIRRLFSGETLNYKGEIFQLQSPGAEATGVKLGVESQTRKIPLYIGASGPKMLQQTGEIGDGVLLTTLTSPAFVKYAVSQIRQGAEKAQRSMSDIDIASYLLFSVSEDRKLAMESVKKTLALYITRVEPIVLEKGGLSAQEIARIETGVRVEGVSEVAKKYVTDDMVKTFAIAGTPDDCLERLGEYLNAGLESPIGIQIIGPDVKKAINLIGVKIVPELKRYRAGN